jgi:hypothetical protein
MDFHNQIILIPLTVSTDSFINRDSYTVFVVFNILILCYWWSWVPSLFSFLLADNLNILSSFAISLPLLWSHTVSCQLISFTFKDADDVIECCFVPQATDSLRKRHLKVDGAIVHSKYHLVTAHAEVDSMMNSRENCHLFDSFRECRCTHDSPDVD